MIHSRKTVLETGLKALAARLLRILKVKNSYAGIFLLEAREMRRLGKLYPKTKRGQVPNVLSFKEPNGFPHPEKRGKFLGEIYLNKAIARGGQDRFKHLLIHGLLHILGYTHDKKADTLKMEKVEKKLARKILTTDS